MSKNHYAELLPPLSTQEYDALKASIKAEGIRIPIVVDEDGNILDGFHRFKIDAKAPRKVLRGLTEAEKMAFVFEANLTRRNLSVNQKKEAAKEMRKIANALRKENPKKNTQAKVAARLGVGQQTISDWWQSTRKRKTTTTTGAGNRRTPDKQETSKRPDAKVKINPKDRPIIFARVEAGESQSQVAADYGVSQQQISSIVTAERKKQEDVAKRKNASKKLKGDVVGIHHGDFRKMGDKLADSSVDLIFTDPPYDEAAVPLYGSLAEFAKRVLRPGGWCLAYAGQSFLMNVLIDMSEYLSYGWCFGIGHTGGDLRFRKYRLQNKWKPVVGFYKPPLEVWWDWFPDFVTGGKEKHEHKLQQAQGEAEHYIKALSPPKGIICDPMCGSGTSLVAAKVLGRQWIGFDIDKATVEKARVRILE